MTIAENMFVAINYTLTLESGQEIDKSPEGQPLGFIAGTGQIIPGLEKALMGRAAGDSAKLVVEPEDAYGPVKDDLLQEIPKNQFPSDLDVTPGMAFEAQGPNGPFMITVARVNDNDTITVDLNHPMAGKQLHFDVNVVEVREPTAEELAKVAASLSSGCGCGSGGSENADTCGC
ncbi:MAG: peptidylprolyl isomerase, partial [Desulfobacterales bacterium]|nr:peptidylprolyl isomerase [Desulfobacterales bacterium]